MLCRVGGDVRVSVVSSTVDGSDNDGGVGIVAGAAQMSVLDESESGLGAGAAHCDDGTTMFSWYLAHSSLAAAARCLSVSGLGLTFFFS